MNPEVSTQAGTGRAPMSGRKVLLIYAAVFVAVSLPFTRVHMVAAPDDAPISPLQHVGAAFANCLGPWGVAVVRLVDFPNAGLRSFSWVLAAGLTLLGAAFIALPLWVKIRSLQIVAVIVWTLFTVAWFGLGMMQIADGLL